MSRNRRRTTQTIKQSDFFSLFKNRDSISANIYSDPLMGYPPENIRRKLSYKEHYWSSSDMYYKLSYKYYGNKDSWWIIARFNGKPTESDLSVGDRLIIPYPLEVVRDYMEFYNG